MKKILFFLATIAVFAIVMSSCQKNIVTEYVYHKDTLNENGFKFAGWFISNPPDKFDMAGDRIYIGDTSTNAIEKLNGKALVHSGPRYVYAVLSFIDGPLSVQREDLKRRGWKIAPLSYLIGLGKEYGTASRYYGNLFCVDIQEKINFGTGAGEEDVAISLNGNTYNPQTDTQYNIGLWIASTTWSWNQSYILAYK